MRRLALIFTCILLAVQSVQAPLYSAPRKKKAQPVKEAPKKTPYEKFVSKKSVKSAGNVMRLYRDGKSFFLELPDSLDGKTLVMSTKLRSSSSAWISPGTEVSSNKAFKIARTDSLLLLLSPSLVPATGDSLIGKAIDRSFGLPTEYSFPIKYRGKDSSSVVVNVSKLFDPSNKDVINLKGVQLDAHASFYRGTVQSEFTTDKELVAFGSSIGAVRSLTFSVAPAYGTAYLDEESMRLTGEFITTLNLLDDKGFSPRIADGRIGTGTVTRSVFTTSGGVKNEKIATRWKVDEGEKITVYVDTLFPAAWQQAIRKGLLAWNTAFEQIGLGKVIDVRPYASYIGFTPENPFISTVRADLHGQGESIGASLLSNPCTGEIVSTTITVPGGIINSIREAGIFCNSDVDSRFASYDISEDAVAEVLKAKIMGIFGRVLGLSPNMAGSYAYSPAQLRSSSFTKVHGITSSVTDDVTFNLLARPGDKEKGVVTIVDKIGDYDKFAISWLYKVFPEGSDEKALLRAMLDESAGRQEYLYCPVRQGNPDPRGIAGDLGNDPFELYSTIRTRLAFVAANATGWFNVPSLENTSFRELFVERLWMYFLSSSRALSSQIGGICFQDMSKGVKATALPVDVQKRTMKVLYSSLNDMSWLDSNQDLLQWSGANRAYSLMTRINCYLQSGLVSRIDWVAASVALAGNEYSLSEYLDDLTALAGDNIRSGKMPVGDDLMFGSYISIGLLRRAPLAARRYAESAHKAGLQEEEALTMPFTGIPAAALSDMQAECFSQLLKIQKILSSGHAAASGDDRYRIEYLQGIVDEALDEKKR
ncbi:MAG: zinc-dependent metalloprotease [Bacteroidales bacterium]|nr:zinc-dependent metalloprotease [Bacteroidales bacterium]